MSPNELWTCPDDGAARAFPWLRTQQLTPLTSPFEKEEEGTGIASDVVKVEGKDPATTGEHLRSVDTRTPRDRNESPISG